MQNKIYNQDTLKRNSLGLQLKLPHSFTFQKGSMFWTQAFCCGRVPVSMYYTVTFQVEINLHPEQATRM